MAAVICDRLDWRWPLAAAYLALAAALAGLAAAGAGPAIAVGAARVDAGPLIAGELRDAGAAAGQVFLSMAPVALAASVLLIALGRAQRRARAMRPRSPD